MVIIKHKVKYDEIEEWEQEECVCVCVCVCV